MNAHDDESISHLTETGTAERMAEQTSLGGLDASQITIERTQTLRPVPEPDSAELWSCKACTDHMVKVRWTDKTGWQAPTISPYGPLTMMPTASCIHYATQCFEGLKAYRGYDGKLRLFRPEKNFTRLVSSAARISLPSFDPKELEKILIAFMKVDGPRWLPKDQPGTFLYIRPSIIGDGEQLGVTPPTEVLMFIIAAPWPDLSNGWAPATGQAPPGLSLIASKKDTRSWPGGFGNAKVGANYGPAMAAHMEGQKLGFDQILWLFGPDFQATEAGASNFFVIWKTKEGTMQLITAPLDSEIILNGVTRGSVLELARERFVEESKYLTPDIQPLETVERTYTMGELVEAHHEGRIVEAFVSGTAYLITSVRSINFQDEQLDIPMATGISGHYSGYLKKTLLDIKYGNVDHPWGVVIEED